MKFTYAWADVSSQNVTLKIVALSLSVCVLILVGLAAKLALKNPILIERACYSKSVVPSNSERTAEEIESFVKEAVAGRFNSDTHVVSSYLTSDEEAFRNQEQKELSNRSMTQKVIVNSIKINGNQISVDADRLISVGQVRSAFSFPLVLSISPETRSEANPYGLVVTKVTQPKAEETNAKK